MQRLGEWVLVFLATTLSLGFGAFVLSQADFGRSDVIAIQLLIRVVGVQIIALGLIGLGAGMLNNEKYSVILLWLTSGALATLTMLGVCVMSPLVFLAFPTLLFINLAMVMNRRWKRNVLTLGLTFPIAAAVNFIFCLLVAFSAPS